MIRATPLTGLLPNPTGCSLTSHFGGAREQSRPMEPASMTTRLALVTVCLLAAAPLHADDANDAAAAFEKQGAAITRDDKDPAHPVVAVSFVGAPITDTGLKNVAALKGLKTLNLTVCLCVTDAGLKHLAGLTNLETLNLGYTGITDKGLKRLATLKSLRTLNLSGTKVTDKGLMELAALTDLHSLILARTSVTDDGVAELQKALPDCKIDR
jgi:Leucine rich repeat